MSIGNMDILEFSLSQRKESVYSRNVVIDTILDVSKRSDYGDGGTIEHYTAKHKYDAYDVFACIEDDKPKQMERRKGGDTIIIYEKNDDVDRTKFPKINDIKELYSGVVAFSNYSTDRKLYSRAMIDIDMDYNLLEVLTDHYTDKEFGKLKIVAMGFTDKINKLIENLGDNVSPIMLFLDILVDKENVNCSMHLHYMTETPIADSSTREHKRGYHDLCIELKNKRTKFRSIMLLDCKSHVKTFIDTFELISMNDRTDEISPDVVDCRALIAEIFSNLSLVTTKLFRNKKEKE